MCELQGLIEKCEKQGINDASDIIRRALAEQHRNTRHDAIEVIREKDMKANNQLFTFIVVDVEHDIMNLKQRSPLSLFVKE